MTNPRAIGIAILGCGVLAMALGPLVVTADPLRQDLARALSPPGWPFPLGSDALGRDAAARLLHGARLSLSIAASSVLTASLAGTLLGLLAAAVGGWVALAVRMAADTALALPNFLLVILIVALTTPGPLGIGMALAATLWVEPCRVVLLTAEQASRSTPVEAARLIGLPRRTIVMRLILPTVLATLTGVVGLQFGQAILSIAALGFLGLGLRPPTPEWGAMILDALPYLQEAPLLFVAPAACIALTVAGLLLATGPRA